MPAARAASSREDPSSTSARASIRREAAPSRHRLASRRRSPAPSSCRVIPTADSRAKRNGLSEADLHVPAKLFEQRLERGQEAEALPRRQVVAEDDLLQLGVAERVQVEVPGQVAA